MGIGRGGAPNSERQRSIISVLSESCLSSRRNPLVRSPGDEYGSERWKIGYRNVDEAHEEGGVGRSKE